MKIGGVLPEGGIYELKFGYADVRRNAHIESCTKIW
ncbi:MAG: hypothetical protein SYNGOMJ08_00191 [Candidatus Syntrophoarchaeum sp. GoM_oil]|nr:MAG: hypothetical protein SYNGOMJ08_00191 [Candidatus Syntrophoarchaeum sp. GoM_oil]